eukprot:SAG11_NODE_27080_length_337_cov_0.810924_1_plen_65_part_00
MDGTLTLHTRYVDLVPKKKKYSTAVQYPMYRFSYHETPGGRGTYTKSYSVQMVPNLVVPNLYRD